MPDPDLLSRAAAARVGRLATVDPDGGVHLVPFCFVIEGDVLYSAVDQKPKRSRDLRRLRNLRERPRATVPHRPLQGGLVGALVAAPARDGADPRGRGRRGASRARPAGRQVPAVPAGAAARAGDRARRDRAARMGGGRPGSRTGPRSPLIASVRRAVVAAARSPLPRLETPCPDLQPPFPPPQPSTIEPGCTSMPRPTCGATSRRPGWSARCRSSCGGRAATSGTMRATATWTGSRPSSATTSATGARTSPRPGPSRRSSWASSPPGPTRTRARSSWRAGSPASPRRA